MGLFSFALETMAKEGSTSFGPVSFQDYISGLGLSARNTAQHISVQKFEDLASELRQANAMVFRLGSPLGERTTNFGLVHTVSGWDDYFFFDTQLFGSNDIYPFLDISDIPELSIFRAFPNFTESSLVNLAFASGLLHKALGIERRDSPSVPVTGKASYSFDVVPHRELDIRWKHVRGQVEIDGVFVAKRRGVKTIFVIEAKMYRRNSSLAKYKLAYPIFALQQLIDPRFQFVGIYLKAHRIENGFLFHIAECDSMATTPLIHSKVNHWVLT